MDISLRTAVPEDYTFARSLYFETMRGMVERLLGWDQAREEENFNRFYKLGEVRIITADGRDVGWMQELSEDAAIFPGSLYVLPAMQRQCVGTHVIQTLLARAKDQSKAATLAVVKINPALRFYERHGFRITDEDKHKFYLRADPSPLNNR